MIALDALFVYPVKALRGVALERAVVGPMGIELDREWMIVDSRGRCVTLTEQPRLALIDVSIEPDALLLTVDGMAPLHLARGRSDSPERDVKLFRRSRRGVAVSAAADRWFSDYLGAPSFVVRLMPDDAVSFANARPFHLVTDASCRDIAWRARSADITLRRFRPNFVVRGAEPYDEDRWCELQIGSVPFRVLEPCVRCAVTCVEIASGRRTVEPLRTLSTYRATRTLTGPTVRFGQYLALGDSRRGVVAVEDAVIVKGGRRPRG